MIEHCPVCHDKRTDLDAIKRHNLRCAETGERAYPERVYVPALPPRR